MKKHYDDKRVIIAKVFSDHLGPSVLSIVGHRLAHKQFYEAWHELNDYFRRDSLQKKMRIIYILNNMSYVLRVPMSKFIQLIRTLCKIHGFLNDDVEMGDEQRLFYLIDAVRRGEGNFSFALDVIDLGNTNFDEAETMLVTRAEAIALSKKPAAKNPANEPKTGAGDNGKKSKKQLKFEAHQAAANDGKKSGSFVKTGTCNACGQTGHWANDPECPKFGQPRTDGKKGGGANKKEKPTKKAAHNAKKDSNDEIAEIHEQWQERAIQAEKDRDALRAQLQKTVKAQANHSHAALNRSMQFCEEEEEENSSLYVRQFNMMTANWKTKSRDPAVNPQMQQPAASSVSVTPAAPRSPRPNALYSSAPHIERHVVQSSLSFSPVAVAPSAPKSVIATNAALDRKIRELLESTAPPVLTAPSTVSKRLQLEDEIEHLLNNRKVEFTEDEEEEAQDDADYAQSFVTLSSKKELRAAKKAAKQAAVATRILPARNKTKHLAFMMQRSSTNGTTRAVFDTGATDNMFASSTGLTNVVSIDPDVEGTVLMGGNKNFALPITGKGVDGILSDVLIVPGLKKDLISGSQLMMGGYLQMYLRDRLYVYDLKSLQLVETGTLLRDNLVHRDVTPHGPPIKELFLDLLSVQAPAADPVPQSQELSRGQSKPLPLTNHQFTFGKAKNRPKAAREKVGNEWTVLHNRTMHAGRQKLFNLVHNRTAIGTCVTLSELKKESMGACVGCYLGKFNKFPAPASFSVQSSLNMHVIRSDIEGPFRTLSVHGSKYWQLHECPKTNFLWIDFMSAKSAASGHLMSMQAKFAEPLSLKIRYLQSDSDQIYKDQKLVNWAESNGVKLQYTAPYRHEGSIEARQKSVLEMVRTVLADATLPEKYWEPIAEAAVYVLNRLPTARFPASCPLTELTGKLPDISNLVPLG